MVSNLSSTVLFTRLAALRRKVIAQNGKFYGRFPGDAEQVRRIVRFLIGQPEGGVRTPSGNLLTPRGLQSLGCQGRPPLTFPTKANREAARRAAGTWCFQGSTHNLAIRFGMLLLPCPHIKNMQVPVGSRDLPVATGLGSYGGMERLHYQLERVWERPDEELSISFLKVRRCL